MINYLKSLYKQNTGENQNGVEMLQINNEGQNYYQAIILSSIQNSSV